VLFEYRGRLNTQHTKKGPGKPDPFFTYVSDQYLRITTGLKYKPLASNIRINSASVQTLEAGTGITTVGGTTNGTTLNGQVITSPGSSTNESF
jgi:hypothetical protein